jgi:hypothetical protein
MMEGTTNTPRLSRYLPVHIISTAHLQTCCYRRPNYSVFRYISDQDYTLQVACTPSCMLHLLSIILHEGVMWEPSMGTSHRLPKPASRKQLINRVTNNHKSTGIVTSHFYIGFASETNRNIGGRRVSQLDVYDQLTHTSPVSTLSSSSAVRVARSVSRNVTSDKSRSAKT